MRAAVIDVGSNSIKVLVAEPGANGSLVEIFSRTLEVRIGTGLGSAHPALTPEAISDGVSAIRVLASDARGAISDVITVVATSAVRDASNSEAFISRVKAETGLMLRILSGVEEANFIGMGLRTDPALLRLLHFNVFDLGGGSLECLSFVDRKVTAAASLPLGCVRLTEMFVSSTFAAMGTAVENGIKAHVREVVAKSGFPMPVTRNFGVVGTGGTLTAVRSMQAAAKGKSLEETSPFIDVSTLREVLVRAGSLGLEARKRIPGLPPTRADVFPAAVATLLTLAELGGFTAYQHSLRNLRWGVAAQATQEQI